MAAVLAFGVLILSLWLSIAAARSAGTSASSPAFAFIGQLGGKAAGGSISVPSGLECQLYLFGRSEAALESAAREELGEPIVEDLGNRVFDVRRGPKPIRAIVLQRPFRFGTSALLLVGPHEDLASVAARYGWRSGMPEAEEIAYPKDELAPTGSELTRQGDVAVQTISFFNRGFEEATYEISDIQAYGYDCLEPLPIRVTVKPLERAEIRLTYPAGSLNHRRAPRSYIEGRDLRSGTGPRSSEEPLSMWFEAPKSSAPELCVRIAPDSFGRPLEIRNLRVTNSAGFTHEASGVWRSDASNMVRIPIRELTDRIDSSFEVTLEYRHLPNRRWRTARASARSREGGLTMPNDAMLGSYRVNGYDLLIREGYFLSIRKRHEEVGFANPTALIRTLLRDDAAWGGREAATEAGELDQRAGLALVVHNVAASPGGLILQVGVFPCGPAPRTVWKTLFLRWRESDPERWEVIARCGGGEQDEETANRLPRLGERQFLVSDRSVLELDPHRLSQWVAANLPPPKRAGSAWYFRKIVGSIALMEASDDDFSEWARSRIEVNLVSGQVRGAIPSGGG